MSEEIKQTATPDTKGFYYSALTDEEKLEYDRMIEMDGLSDEINLLRLKTRSLIKREPDNLMMLIRLITCLERLIRTQARFFNVIKGNRFRMVRQFIESFKLPPDLMSKMAYKAYPDTAGSPGSTGT